MAFAFLEGEHLILDSEIKSQISEHYYYNVVINSSWNAYNDAKSSRRGL